MFVGGDWGNLEFTNFSMGLQALKAKQAIIAHKNALLPMTTSPWVGSFKSLSYEILP